MAITNELCLQLFYRALAEEIGIAVHVPESDVANMKQQLYTARKEARDPTLDAIIIFQPEPEADGKVELWLCKKDTELS